MAVDMTEAVEPTPCPYVVKIFTTRGALVFQGTVTQQGDFIHLHEHAGSSRCVTLRVHDMTPTLMEPPKLIDGMSGT
jgi:hypothetical protein